MRLYSVNSWLDSDTIALLLSRLYHVSTFSNFSLFFSRSLSDSSRSLSRSLILQVPSEFTWKRVGYIHYYRSPIKVHATLFCTNSINDFCIRRANSSSNWEEISDDAPSIFAYVHSQLWILARNWENFEKPIFLRIFSKLFPHLLRF